MAELNLIGNQDLGGIPILPQEAIKPIDWAANFNRDFNAGMDLQAKIKGVKLQDAQRKTAFAENDLKAQQTSQAQQMLSNLQKKLPPNATALDLETAQAHLKVYGYVPESGGVIDMNKIQANLTSLQQVAALNAQVRAAGTGGRVEKVEAIGADGKPVIRFLVVDPATGTSRPVGQDIPAVVKGNEFEKHPPAVASTEFDSLRQINDVVPQLRELKTRLDELTKNQRGPLAGPVLEAFKIWSADYKDIEARSALLVSELASKGVVSESARTSAIMLKHFAEVLPSIANTPEQATRRFDSLMESFKNKAAGYAGTLVAGKQDPTLIKTYLGGIFTPEEQDQVLSGVSPRQHLATRAVTEKPATPTHNTLRPNPANNGQTWFYKDAVTGVETEVSHEDAANMELQHIGLQAQQPPNIPVTPIHPSIQIPSLQPGGAQPFESWGTGAPPTSLGTDWWKLPINPQP